MGSRGRQGQSDERKVHVRGTLDVERQQRGEAALGWLSYRLLASKAYRYGGQRTYLVGVLARELAECLRHTRSQSAFLNAQILLWDCWSHVFMHLEDVAPLVYATVEFGKQWDMHGKADADLICRRYLSFGDPQAQSGASPPSMLEQIGSNLAKARRALWLPSRKDWRGMFPGAPDGAYLPVTQTAQNLRRVAREILRSLESGPGRKWYESYLRFKHGMAMVALDLFDGVLTMQYPLGSVPNESAVRADAQREVRRMRILMARDPRSPGCQSPHLQSFDCNATAAEQVLGSSQRLSEIEGYICKSVVHRAESDGTREFLIIRREDQGGDGPGPPQ